MKNKSPTHTHALGFPACLIIWTVSLKCQIQHRQFEEPAPLVKWCCGVAVLKLQSMNAWYMIYRKLNYVTSGKYSVKTAGDTIQTSHVLNCSKSTKIFYYHWANTWAKMESTNESAKGKWHNWKIKMRRRDQLRAKEERRHWMKGWLFCNT